ncbi:MAG: hypothetical protein REU00_14700 [Pseudomonadota bacterium]|nr:hypothetical protein [Pseudomonadota bacterium]
MNQQGVRYTRSKDTRQLVGAAHLLPSGKWAARAFIVSDVGVGVSPTEVEIPIPSDAPLFNTDYQAADYAMKIAVQYAANYPSP